MPLSSRPNLLLLITDQQRQPQHWPDDPAWMRELMPNDTELARTGLTFNRAFCNTCMCSPSRATLFTGFFPAQHGVKYTLEETNTDPAVQVPLPLPTQLPNLATVMSAAGYNVPYKGKWHLSKEIGGEWIPQVVTQYGFERWNPPDAGTNLQIAEFGGGAPDNDGRYMEDEGAFETGYEGVLEYLTSAASRQQPFFLVVSLVNPHDVFAYPNAYDSPGAGYDNSDLIGTITLPETQDEDISRSKPTAQAASLAFMADAMGAITSDQQKLAYLNFYGNLMKESDAYLVQILDTLDREGLTDNTLVIYTSDHGEMGLAHGGLRQKVFNFYEETLRVPLIFSNPKLYKKALSTNVMVSHVDFVPTMATLLDVPLSARAEWAGVGYANVIRNPKNHKGPQKYVVFTFDDWQAFGQPENGSFVPPPNHLSCIREGRYKLARYYDVDGTVPDQWEMYDLKHDPLEKTNIAWPDYPRNKKQNRELHRLKRKLAEVEAQRLQPL
jgi:arylsulfatase A-like enzyme